MPEKLSWKILLTCIGALIVIAYVTFQIYIRHENRSANYLRFDRCTSSACGFEYKPNSYAITKIIENRKYTSEQAINYLIKFDFDNAGMQCSNIYIEKTYGSPQGALLVRGTCMLAQKTERIKGSETLKPIPNMIKAL
jgi:hypothetical protein